MAGNINNIVDTDIKNIRTFREVHKTSERNAFIEEAEKQAAIKEAGGRQNLTIENERQTAKKEEQKKADRAAKEHELKMAMEEKTNEEIGPTEV